LVRLARRAGSFCAHRFFSRGSWGKGGREGGREGGCQGRKEEVTRKGGREGGREGGRGAYPEEKGEVLP
jgi:hypothetical protein